MIKIRNIAKKFKLKRLSKQKSAMFAENIKDKLLKNAPKPHIG